jgi:hypothetical protein
MQHSRQPERMNNVSLPLMCTDALIMSFFFVPDCLHLQLYRDSKDRYKQGQTKASLSLQHFLGVESGGFKTLSCSIKTIYRLNTFMEVVTNGLQ